MATNTSSSALVDFGSSFGAFVIGTFLAVFLGGVTAGQCATYYIRFHLIDPIIHKTLVYSLFLLDTAQSAVCCYTVYYWTVAHYGDPSVLMSCPWPFTVNPILTALVTLISQSFFAYRVFLISEGNRCLPAIISILSGVQFGFGTAAGVLTYKAHDRLDDLQAFTYGVIIWLVSASIADVLITSSLVYLLRNASKDQFAATQTVIAKIIRNTIQTNALTTVVSLINVVLFVLYPGLAGVAPSLLLVKLYFSSLLVSFNSRQSGYWTREFSGERVSCGIQSESHEPTKDSIELSNGALLRRSSRAENGQLASRIVVHQESVLEREKLSSSEPKRRTSSSSVAEEIGSGSVPTRIALAIPPRIAVVPSSWDEAK